MTTEVSRDAREGLPDMIRRAWSDALGHDDFGDDDYFFSIGGTSLSAIKVMRSISAAVGTKLPLRMLFTHQSVTLLHGAVREAVAPDA